MPALLPFTLLLTLTTPAQAPAPESLGALDYAFRFATAITSDAKDRAKAQELALTEYAAAGAFDEAAKRAPQIEGWRRGMVYASLATRLAQAGRADEARDFVRKAEEVRSNVSGWENPRISSQVAEALALLGDTEQSARIAADLAAADPIQYAGHAAATNAVGEVTKGDFAAAMDRLKTVENNNDLDVAWSRTMGYLALARQDKLPKSSRLEALTAARASAERLPFERRLDALLQIAPVSQDLGRKKDAREAVAAAVDVLQKAGSKTPEAIPGFIAIGHAWAGIDEPGRARKYLQEAEVLVPGALSIDQPGLIERIASGYRKVPDVERAHRLDLKAVDNAAAMRLSRPRALALSAICRLMGKDGVVPDDAFKSRLESLLAGLGEPW
jgi:tetratricopeptide (TPR) repeat protein